jgi:hypothetical protein
MVDSHVYPASSPVLEVELIDPYLSSDLEQSANQLAQALLGRWTSELTRNADLLAI